MAQTNYNENREAKKDKKSIIPNTSNKQSKHKKVSTPPTNRPTDNRPAITDQTATNQMHRPQTNRPPTSKKFEYQKKFQFIFDINHDFKYRVFEIMLCIMYRNC